METTAGKSVLENKTNMQILPAHLSRVAVKGLQGMFDAKNQLFSYRTIRTETGVVNEGASLRYTIISLLGLHQWEENGGKSPVDIQNVLPALIDSEKEIDNIGDLGLLLWLIALASPQMVRRIWSHFNIQEALSHYRDAIQGRTMELAWFLSGLAHVKLLGEEGIQGLNEMAALTSKRLFQNYGGRGIFRHVREYTPTGFVRGRIGNFADQVYPMYALSKFSQAFDSQVALDVALDCAKSICKLQGPYGQWWWHYDAATGRVVGRYPVYSVHQDGMAPMALSAVGEATGIDFRESISRGLRWVEGNNELGVTMIDPTRNVIWRCFDRDKYKLVASELFSIVKNSHPERTYKDLKIRYECRPYHLGWLLYALGNPPSARS